MPRIRIILFGLFILSFTITASTLVLYADGWRLDLSEKKLVQTGAVFLNMNVREAKIFLNNELQKTTSPISSSVLINNILPGIKKIRVEKDGFASWEKEIRVEPQQTNRFLNVLLLANEIKQTAILPNEQLDGISDFSASPNGNIIAIQQKDKKIKLWNRQREKEIESDMLTLPFKWSSDGTVAITKQTPQSGNLTVFPNITEEKPSESVRIPVLNEPEIFTDNEKFIVGTIGKNIENTSTLISIKLLNETTPQTKTYELARKIKTFTLNQNNVYFIDQQYILWKIKPDGSDLKQISKSSLSLAQEEDIKLTAGNSEDNFAVRETNSGTIWIFDPKIQSFERIAQNILATQFSPDGEKLMLTSSNEIWVFFIEETFTPKRTEKTLELILRLSGQIKNTWWHGQNEHILFEYDDSVQIIELENGLKRNSGILLNNYIKIQETKNNREIIVAGKNELFNILVPRIEGFLSF